MTDSVPPAAAATPAPKFCAECGAPLAPTARFCHNCGTPLGSPVGAAGNTAASDLPGAGAEEDQGLDLGVDAPLVTRSGGALTAMPWIVALVGLVAGAGYVSATQKDAPSAPAGAPPGMVAPFANGGGGGGGAPPDLASMSPNERANRLYGRIMAYVQAGKADSAAFFAPMALAAHEMLENPSVDERYHLGQINEMLGNAAVAAAHADTILKAEPENLLGLMLATHAAQLANKPADVKTYNALFLKVLDAQLAAKKPEYEMHRAEIDRTAAEARGGK